MFKIVYYARGYREPIIKFVEADGYKKSLNDNNIFFYKGKSFFNRKTVHEILRIEIIEIEKLEKTQIKEII